MKNWINWQPVVTTLASREPAARAAEVFCEEIALRTGFALETSGAYLCGRSNVVLGTREAFSAHDLFADRLSALPVPGPEGFSLLVVPEGGYERTVLIVGADLRGVFFGMGKLLRLLYLTEGRMMIDGAQSAFTSTPKYPLRGQQLAYRDKQNTCPCWTQREFDRYIRDLALFGNNAIELLPPRSDDTLFSRVFQVDPFDMMLDLSRIIHSYGMDVWLWYPNMGEEYENPETRVAEIAEREKIFSSIPYLDAVLIPAGDPGDLNPSLLFPVCEEAAAVLHRHHPHATVWLAPQVMTPDATWYDSFYAAVGREPEWLYGLCFAPWVQDTIQEMHARLPEKYKSRIRHYPDITHNFSCQFPAPNWDTALAIFEGRECNNTRPLGMKHIHNLHAPYTCGSLTYSEGIHDDVNKFVWSQQDWDDTQPAEATVREYVRLLIDPALEEPLTRALMRLEENWEQPVPISDNTVIDETYALWTSLEAEASSKTRQNYRFLLGLMRALSDYYTRHKQLYDDRTESEALDVLGQAESLGADAAMRGAAAIYLRGADIPWDDRLRSKILALSDTLHRLCGIKLTTKHHAGQFFRRGAYLDLIDFPLNNQQYMLTHFKRIRTLDGEPLKCAEIGKLLRRTDPGEGGIYVNLGSLSGAKHIHFAHSWAEDPGYLRTAYLSACSRALIDAFTLTGTHLEYPIAREWFSFAITNFATPLIASFDGLDPKSAYRLRIVYLQPGRSLTVRLTTGTGDVIHESVEQKSPHDPVYTYPLPPASYADGTLELCWQAHTLLGGASVNEVFIEKV